MVTSTSDNKKDIQPILCGTHTSTQHTPKNASIKSPSKKFLQAIVLRSLWKLRHLRKGQPSVHAEDDSTPIKGQSPGPRHHQHQWIRPLHCLSRTLATPNSKIQRLTAQGYARSSADRLHVEPFPT